MRYITLFLLFSPSLLLAGQDSEFRPESLLPDHIPVARPALEELSSALRARKEHLGLNGLPGPGGKVSRALLLLPADRSGAGVLSFEIEGGEKAGVWQCEALGRGATSLQPKDRWRAGLIDGATIYYAPKDMADGATIPGVYDLRNISPADYEIAVLGKPDPRVLALTASPAKRGKGKVYFSAVLSDWYPAGSSAEPVDLIWAKDSQKGSQGGKVPVFELPPGRSSPEAASLRARQLAADPGYYSGPYGRYGFAVHTDRWEDPARLSDPSYSGRPEKSDFRWRDTSGCVKLRPACLELLNAFISDQRARKRRPQLEVYETPLLDGIPREAPAR
ncbi:MAG: hypothetical protein M0011_15665 [Elusimicrobia bacterium]|nr:hypothetical protein [Elusimicrobiota bacterium]